MKKLHLICNAHIDPVWLWEWEEGAASALSTFRSAVKLADRFDYIFCHNEALLYKWVEEYDPALFNDIKRLVKSGKWRIIGGWYLQPDCNLPSGESFVRQIQEGRKYFAEKFGIRPTTAVNFDSFGHSVGLVQILRKCGYDSYLCCRPAPCELNIPDDCVWEGPDGSRVELKRASGHYNSGLGHAEDKIRAEIARSASDTDIVLWGVGNHGGGPSAKDLTDIARLKEEYGFEIVHSTPEAYFAERSRARFVWNRGLNDCMPGCYTSMIRIKQLHKELENQLYMTEKMLSHAAMLNLTEYPHAELTEATHDLLKAEFHDILPGSAIKPAYEYGLRVMHHGLEILNRLRARAFFALLQGEREAKEGEFPVFVYNPHPYPVHTVVDAGFNLEEQNYDDYFTDIEAYDGDSALKTQIVKEKSNLNLDWAKRVRFECELKPSSINRFDLKKKFIPARKSFAALCGDKYTFEGRGYRAEIDLRTGWIDKLVSKGFDFISAPLGRLAVEIDNEDPWAMRADQLLRIGKPDGAFSLLNPCEGSVFSGIRDKTIPSVRLVEDGEVYTEIEAVFGFRRSSARIGYIFYKNINAIDVNVDLFMEEKDGIVRLQLPSSVLGETYAQIAFGQEKYGYGTSERIMHRWVMRADDGRAFALVNRSAYAFRNEEEGIFVTLVRGAAYSAHPIRDRRITPGDRYTARMDQGEQNYSFRILFGARDKIEENIEAEAAVFNEEPFALNVFPSGDTGVKSGRALEISDRRIVVCALKQTCDGTYVARLQNNSANNRKITLVCPPLHIKSEVSFGAFEVKTLIFTEGRMNESAEMII